MNDETLRQQLEYYRDLGVKEIYRRPPSAAVLAAADQTKTDAVPAPSLATFPSSAKSPAAPAAPSAAPILTPTAPQAAPIAASIATQAAPLADGALPPLAPPGETLFQILEDLGDCRRCRLHEGRNKIVFGVGDPHAPLVFVGEGPGADEDEQGIPFVGRAGQLLTQMIENTAKKEGIPLGRSDVYICNVVKCRPPGNRTPEPDEMEICGQFLYRQLLAMRPKAICALGGTAARALTGRKEGVTKMRGRWFEWNQIPVMVTYHPSYLLRPYNQDAKREAWEDLKKTLHFVYG
jgi:uracil-DNA glycosylase